MNDLLKFKPKFDSYLSRCKGVLPSAFSFVNIAAWSDFFRFEWVERDGCLCVFAHQDIGCFQYLPPLGPCTPEIVDFCFAHMRAVNKGSALTRMENVDPVLLETFDPARYIVEPRAHEYCYFRRDIADMRGPGYASPRWMWNHFRKRHAYTFEPFGSGDLDECRKLYQRWAAAKSGNVDDLYRHMLAENEIAHRRVMENAGALGVTGRVVRVNGTIAAYTFGYPVGAKMFCDVFEITDPDLKGLPTVIFREFCRDEEVAVYDFINVMDDFGMPRIGQTKMHFKPRFLWPSYTVRPR